MSNKKTEKTPQDIIYKTVVDKVKIALYAKDGSIWLIQNQLANLFDTSKQSISYHIINILNDNELDERSVVKNYLTTASKKIVGKVYEAFDTKRKQFEAQQADLYDLKKNRSLGERYKTYKP